MVDRKGQSTRHVPSTCTYLYEYLLGTYLTIRYLPTLSTLKVVELGK